jgi:hypothetical protein
MSTSMARTVGTRLFAMTAMLTILMTAISTMHGDHVDEHVIAVSASNPVHCTPEIRCSGHAHGPNCGHEAIPHGDHIDYLVNGRLHHTHGDHCDDHGPVQLV